MGYLYQVAGHDPAITFGWPASPRERRRLEDELLALIEPALAAAAALAGIAPASAARPLLDDFLTLYARRPLAENKGGSGLNDSLWLFLLARLIDPALLIESGTWRGQSAWLFRQACPGAEIVSFDVAVPAEGRCETPGVRYCLCDWSTEPLAPPASGRGLVFFDDHVSHARRLAEAAARGFVLALFDDNFAARHLHATGAPPVPTLAMLLDEATPPGGVIEWQRNGKIYRYDDTAERRLAARRLVAGHLTLPELAPVTRHPPGSGLTLVRLRASA
jgi:hypothetical protein